MEQIIDFVQQLPWQIGLLLYIVRTEMLAHAVRRREQMIPLTMVERLITEFKAVKELGQEHARTLVEHGGRVVVLERRQKTIDDWVATNAAEHREILEKLSEISARVATVAALQRKANGA